MHMHDAPFAVAFALAAKQLSQAIVGFDRIVIFRSRAPACRRRPTSPHEGHRRSRTDLDKQGIQCISVCNSKCGPAFEFTPLFASRIPHVSANAAWTTTVPPLASLRARGIAPNATRIPCSWCLLSPTSLSSRAHHETRRKQRGESRQPTFTGNCPPGVHIECCPSMLLAHGTRRNRPVLTNAIDVLLAGLSHDPLGGQEGSWWASGRAGSREGAGKCRGNRPRPDKTFLEPWSTLR